MTSVSDGVPHCRRMRDSFFFENFKGRSSDLLGLCTMVVPADWNTGEMTRDGGLSNSGLPFSVGK